MSISPLLTISEATICKNGKTIFQDLDFVIQPGEQWAILAASGLEKTAFLETLYGSTSVTKGSVRRPFAAEYQAEQTKLGKVNSFRDLVAFLSQSYAFKNKSNVQEFYYQQRFNSADSEEAATVQAYLQELPDARPGYWNIYNTLQLLELEQVANKSLIKLSNGETRRLAIAMGLLRNPKIYLMDRPLTGLDQKTREAFDSLLERIIASGIHVVLTTTPQEIPKPINRVALLHEGRCIPVSEPADIPATDADWSPEQLRKFDSLLSPYPEIPYETLVKLNGVNIRYGEKQILQELSWTVKPQERWVLKGHNGAGKSTLISMLIGENPQAYASDFYLFDRKRGSGETIWDVKRPTGFVSPELSRYFPKNQTCLKVVLSGLFDTIGLFRRVDTEAILLAEQWLDAFQLSHVKNSLLHQVSLEDQRFCLLARALIKKPALLVLDEASQGMDEEQRRKFRSAIDHLCSHTPIGLIFVSHYNDDIPKAVTQEIVLEQGIRIS